MYVCVCVWGNLWFPTLCSVSIGSTLYLTMSSWLTEWIGSREGEKGSDSWATQQSRWLFERIERESFRPMFKRVHDSHSAHTLTPSAKTRARCTDGSHSLIGLHKKGDQFRVTVIWTGKGLNAFTYIHPTNWGLVAFPVMNGTTLVFVLIVAQIKLWSQWLMMALLIYFSFLSCV